jgi:hypothetical protein
MNEAFFAELSAWLMQAGLAGTSETDIVSGFCERFAAGLPLARTAHVRSIRVGALVPLLGTVLGRVVARALVASELVISSCLHGRQ